MIGEYDAGYENCINSMVNEAADMQFRIDNLQRENDKLRELLRDLWQFTGTACKRYPKLFDQSAQGGQAVRPNAIDAFEQRICELGVVE